jgi:hypothetical protein
MSSTKPWIKFTQDYNKGKYSYYKKSYKNHDYYVVINHLFALCGYVEDTLSRPQERYFFDPYEYDLDVHGGVTYNGEAYFNKKDKRLFIGFDCAHACDNVPKLSYIGENLPWRNEKYVERQCRKLINQLIKLKGDH